MGRGGSVRSNHPELVCYLCRDVLEWFGGGSIPSHHPELMRQNLCTSLGWFKHVEPHQAFSTHMITERARCVKHHDCGNDADRGSVRLHHPELMWQNCALCYLTSVIMCFKVWWGLMCLNHPELVHNTLHTLFSCNDVAREVRCRTSLAYQSTRLWRFTGRTYADTSTMVIVQHEEKVLL